MMPMSAKVKVGLRVKAIREARDMRREDFAYAIGTTRQYINSVENGHIDLKIGTISRLSAGLGLSLGHFFEDDVFLTADDGNPATLWVDLPPNTSVARLLARPSPEQAVLDYVRTCPEATLSSAMTATGLSRSRVERAFNSLRDAGQLAREGTNRTGRWVVVDADGGA